MALTIELIARVVVACAALSLLGAGAFVLVRENLESRPAPIEKRGGLLALANYLGIGLFVVCGLAAALTNLGTIGRVMEPLGDAIRLAGVAVLWAAGLLAGWGIATMGKHLVSGAEVRPDTALVTGGPFGLVRHPMYLSIVLLWLGASLALLNPALLLGTAILTPVLAARSKLEEEMLTRHFGRAYEEYAARVPMLIPGPSVFRPRGRT